MLIIVERASGRKFNLDVDRMHLILVDRRLRPEHCTLATFGGMGGMLLKLSGGHG